MLKSALDIFFFALILLSEFQSGKIFSSREPQWKFRFQNTWTLFNFTDTQTSDGYCVFKPFEFGATGYGPC